LTTTLDQILEQTRKSLPGLRRRMGEFREVAEALTAAPSWTAALAGPHVSVIAEVKRRSPSVGSIARDLEPAQHARAYELGGASAISVLTEARYFGGCLGDLNRVSEVVTIPVLRKDFILDSVQVYESRAAGAAAILLIVRALDPVALHDLSTLAGELGLGAILEVHDLKELDIALQVSANCIGVNSRDLATFQVDLTTLAGVLDEVPSHVVAVAESGLKNRADVEKVASWGADAVLVGTVLASASDPCSAVRDLTGIARHGRS
jgi:indole-3-glycerol phosphate synthase